MPRVRKISPCLWFDFNAKAAVDHYLSIFTDGRVVDVLRYGDAGPGPKGAVMVMTFEIGGQPLIALNGGPQFPFTEAISLSVDCETQVEVDALWERLSEGGSKGRCGWLKDTFGLSWQIVPAPAKVLLQDPSQERAQRVMPALLGMHKIDIGYRSA